MTLGRRKTNQQELMAAAMVDALQNSGILESLKSSNAASVTSRLTQLYATTPQPRIDGRITWADLVTTGGFVIVASGTGFIIGGSAWASTGEFAEMLFWWGRSTQIAGTLALVRLGADMLNIAGVWQATIGELLDWADRRKENKEEPKETVRFIPYSGPALEPKQPEPHDPDRRFIELLHPDKKTIYEMSRRELMQFFSTANELNDWTRDGWCGSKKHAGRGMSQPVWAALRNTLEPLDVWKARPPALQAFVSTL